MDKLAIVSDSFSKANKALREVIQNRDDEIGRLEYFENYFQHMQERYDQFKPLAMKSIKDAGVIQERLKKELLNHQQTIENLKSQIKSYRSEIDKQSLENERLENQLKESVKSFNNDEYLAYSVSAYANANVTTSLSSTLNNTNTIAQRFREEC